MRFAIGATVALAAAVVRADDASSAEAESSTPISVPKPTFTVSIPSASGRAELTNNVLYSPPPSKHPS
jgi:hypothetical protein